MSMHVPTFHSEMRFVSLLAMASVPELADLVFQAVLSSQPFLKGLPGV